MTVPFLNDDPRRAALKQIAAIASEALTVTRLPKPRRSLFAPLAESPAEAEDERPPALACAKLLYAARRRRDRAFSNHADLLFDPVWDILLDLFVAWHDRRTVSVSSACLAACAAPTTALRWIATLEGRGLIERTPDFEDRRRHFVSLSPEGLALVEDALAQM